MPHLGRREEVHDPHHRYPVPRQVVHKVVHEREREQGEEQDRAFRHGESTEHAHRAQNAEQRRERGGDRVQRVVVPAGPEGQRTLRGQAGVLPRIRDDPGARFGAGLAHEGDLAHLADTERLGDARPRVQGGDGRQHVVNVGDGAGVVPDEQLEPQVAANEEDAVQRGVIAPCPRNADQERRERHDPCPDPPPRIPAPPQLEGETPEHDRQQHRLKVEREAGPGPEKQRPGRRDASGRPPVPEGEHEQTEEHGGGRLEKRRPLGAHGTPEPHDDTGRESQAEAHGEPGEQGALEGRQREPHDPARVAARWAEAEDPPGEAQQERVHRWVVRRGSGGHGVGIREAPGLDQRPGDGFQLPARVRDDVLRQDLGEQEEPDGQRSREDQGAGPDLSAGRRPRYGHGQAPRRRRLRGRD